MSDKYLDEMHRLTKVATQPVYEGRRTLDTPDKHQLRVLKQLMRAPDAAVPIMGGGYRNKDEVRSVLRNKFGYTDRQIARLEESINEFQGIGNPYTMVYGWVKLDVAKNAAQEINKAARQRNIQVTARVSLERDYPNSGRLKIAYGGGLSNQLDAVKLVKTIMGRYPELIDTETGAGKIYRESVQEQDVMSYIVYTQAIEGTLWEPALVTQNKTEASRVAKQMTKAGYAGVQVVETSITDKGFSAPQLMDPSAKFKLVDSVRPWRTGDAVMEGRYRKATTEQPSGPRGDTRYVTEGEMARLAEGWRVSIALANDLRDDAMGGKKFYYGKVDMRAQKFSITFYTVHYVDRPFDIRTYGDAMMFNVGHGTFTLDPDGDHEITTFRRNEDAVTTASDIFRAKAGDTVTWTDPDTGRVHTGIRNRYRGDAFDAEL